MSFLTLRPTFDLGISSPRQVVWEQVIHRLDRETWTWIPFRFDQYLELHIPIERRRYWTPHLALSFDENDGTTSIHGRFAPRQEVWTLVWIAYLAFAFSGFFALMFAYSAWHTNQSIWPLWLALVSLLGIGTIYGASHIGQCCSKDQMEELKAQWMALLKDAFPHESIELPGAAEVANPPILHAH